jgi:hypothetical protein
MHLMLHKSESVLAASPIIPIAATPLAPRAYRTDALAVLIPVYAGRAYRWREIIADLSSRR